MKIVIKNYFGSYKTDADYVICIHRQYNMLKEQPMCNNFASTFMDVDAIGSNATDDEKTNWRREKLMLKFLT